MPEKKCNKLCTDDLTMYSTNCPVHGALALRKSKVETTGKRTSEGYKPATKEKVEVRGD